MDAPKVEFLRYTSVILQTRTIEGFRIDFGRERLDQMSHVITRFNLLYETFAANEEPFLPRDYSCMSETQLERRQTARQFATMDVVMLHDSLPTLHMHGVLRT